MAEIVVGLVGLAIELGKCIVAPIKRQFNYLCCFNSNVKSLDEEAKKLELERVGLQMEVESAKNNGRVIDPKVETWLEEVEQIQQNKSVKNVQGGDCLSRYSASRKAVKIAAAMKQKQEDRRDITIISHPPDPVSMVPDIERPTTEFESRKEIEQDLMAILKDERVGIVGICGMGGVGKTTLAQKIKKKMEDVFGESVMVVVSQPADRHKIQGDIADQLMLELKETSIFSRAQRLAERLRGGKRILIVLDDVWESLDLKELGIPCESGCTVLLTSRNRGVLAKMDAQPICVVDTLTERESWSLFKEKLGTCGDDQNLQLSSLAKEIANECKGLPLALASVAGALKDEKNISVWKDALLQLRSSNPQDLSDVLKDVYTPLKLSYGYLSSQNARSVFLLCSIFPEDFDIPLADLTAYAMGLRMFEEIGALEQVADKTCLLVKMLISRFLLLEGRDEQHVRMHDVVRDVAIYIASKEMSLIRSGYNSTWISPYVGGERIELSMGSTFENLHLLLIDKSADEELQISGISFEGMKKLNVLSICNVWSLTSLPRTTQNLKTLILDKCESLKTISIVGELLDLEILICRWCNVMEEIPLEKLKCLKWLEISRCEALEKIGPAGHQTQHIKILSKLESLQLQDLPNLTDFYQGVENIEFPLLTQLEIENCPKLKGLISSPKSVRMGDDGDDHSLHLLCNQKVSFGKLRELVLCKNGNCNSIFCSSQIPVGSFTHLQMLYLHGLPKLKTFCNSALWLPQLVYLKISYCHEMRSFNSGSLTKTTMNNLESLCISSCQMMEHVFLWSEEENKKTITFPKLTTLELMFLPRLTSICKGVESIDFPLLTDMSIDDCPNLTSLVSADINKLNKQTVYYSLPIWDQIPLRNFNRLELLRISGYGEISSLFSSSVAVNLINLKELIIGDCKNMVKVIEEEAEEYSHQTLFPHLELLRLYDLPKLKFFCGWSCALKLPLLEKVVIFCNCPNLSSFSLGSLTTPNLKTIEIEKDDVITNTEGIIDMNNVLQQRFNRENSTLSEGQEDSKKKGEIEEEEEEEEE